MEREGGGEGGRQGLGTYRSSLPRACSSSRPWAVRVEGGREGGLVGWVSMTREKKEGRKEGVEGGREGRTETHLGGGLGLLGGGLLLGG